MRRATDACFAGVPQCDDSEPPLVGAQLVEVNDIEVLGFTLEEVMDTLKDAPAPGVLSAKCVNFTLTDAVRIRCASVKT